jgi:hypothetical protein
MACCEHCGMTIGWDCECYNCDSGEPYVVNPKKKVSMHIVTDTRKLLSSMDDIKDSVIKFGLKMFIEKRAAEEKMKIRKRIEDFKWKQDLPELIKSGAALQGEPLCRNSKIMIYE